MNWGDARYGTVAQSTRDGADQRITLMVIGPVPVTLSIYALVIDLDEDTRFWRLGRVAQIDGGDFWRFEVVE